LVIRALEELTTEWLSAVLDSPVEAVDIESSQPFGSVNAYLTLTYGDRASPDAPPRLFFKMSSGQDGAREVRFYEAMQDHGSDVPLSKVYAAAYADDGFHLLMDDLSVTHKAADQEIPPYRWQCEAAMDTLARLHARWRGDIEFLRAMDKYPLADTGWTFDMNMAPAYTEFLEWLGERLPPRTQAIYEKVIESLPRLSLRYRDVSMLTLIHGDAHFWNFLYPKVQGSHPAYLIDWEALDVGTGLEDVAYGMVLFWTAERRSRLERGLVERYHRGVIRAGGD